MQYRTIPLILSTVMIASCGSERVVVDRAGPDDLLKLRAGPGLGYQILLGLPDGTELTRQECVTEVGQLWCEVALADDPNVTGFVSADYLAPR